MPELRPYQLEAVKDILYKKKVLVADDMGLGKTAEAISARVAIENRQSYDARTLVVCPNSVTQHWEGEIKLWYKKREKTKVVLVQKPTYDSDLKLAENADFVIIGYPTLSTLGNEKTRIEKLGRLGFQYGVIDEAHNAKNPDSIRSMAVKGLFDSMDYLSILSGTPIPNSVQDIYMLLSLLDKDQLPINVENSRAVLTSFYRLFRDDPEFVRRILNDRMLRRTADEYLHAKFPELRQRNLEIQLDGEHREVYESVYENDNIRPGDKLWQLVKASVDPNLVDHSLLPRRSSTRMQSSVYTALDDLIERSVDSNGKVLIFSDLRSGVTDYLSQRYNRYGAEHIDSNVSSARHNGDLSIREETRRRFQNDPDCKVLIATTVMDEGVDLTAATDIVHLTLPYTPATFDQRNRRSQRIGEVQKDYTNVHVVKPVVDVLTPVITDGVQRLLDDKRRIITYIIKEPFSLTTDDLEEIKNGSAEGSRHLSPYIHTPIRSIMAHFGQLKGQGFNRILAHYGRYPEEAETIARLYANHWEGYYGGNTANLNARVVALLGESEGLERKLDIASGPFSLSRKIRVPVVNLDINNYMLQAGRILENEGKVVNGNVAVQGTFHQLPFEDGTFDLTNCSLALHMSRMKIPYKRQAIPERELAFREMNRVLREGGYALVTLPYTLIADSDLRHFYDGLGELGFEVLPFSGFYKGPEDSKFTVYLAGLRKVSEPSKKHLDESLLAWKMDQNLGRTRGRSKTTRRHLLPEPKEIKREFIDNFYDARSGKTLEEVINSFVIL